MKAGWNCSIKAWTTRQAGLVEKIGGAKLLGVERFVEGTLGVGHHPQEYHEQKYVGDVELPQSVVHADPSNKETLTLHGATVHHAGGIAGDQDEDLGSIGEHHRLKRKLRQDVVREVIEEDAEEGKTAEEIKPEIALHSRRITCDGHQITPEGPSAGLQNIFVWLAKSPTT